MLLDYPPAAYMLAVLGSGPEDEKLVQAMYYLKLYIERIYRENDLHIIGPAYASVGKVKDIYRQVIYLKHKDHKTLVPYQRPAGEIHRDKFRFPENIHTI